ncbi:hypothetical protein PRIPAC_84473 [Pristionchus pacificus]|uniref:Uncharacterized protein n=1 Tax=Pristionchus pacificus TaxID=54126 RepID=A0A2A6BNE0_PRIPA|nr:hypothetical protein PRIPAC_84473 [Pristionchus pacificus]|eukprot:PDM67419.1 hypothetical protein PRIPAC_48836 [Pristionchus pacificus]
MSSLLNGAFESVMRIMKRKREEEQEEEHPVKKGREDFAEGAPSETPAKRLVSESLLSKGKPIKEEEIDFENERPIISEMDFRRNGSVEADAMIDNMFQCLEELDEDENEENTSEMFPSATNIEVRTTANEEHLENDSSSSIPEQNTLPLFHSQEVAIKTEPVEEERSEATEWPVSEEMPRQAEKEIKMEVTEEVEQEGPSTTASFNGNQIVVSVEWQLMNAHNETVETEEGIEEETRGEVIDVAKSDVETAIDVESVPEPSVPSPPKVVRRSSRVVSREVEETEEQGADSDFWIGKTSSNKCPRCDEKVGKCGATRKAHYKKYHYDVFFAVAPKMNDVERWISCRIGASGEDTAKDARVCLSCNNNQLYRGRIALLKHIKQCHRTDFPKLKESYRLYSRTRRPEDLAVQRMLN